MSKNCLRLLFVIITISITGNCFAQKRDTAELSKIFGGKNTNARTANLGSTIDCTPLTKSGCNYISNNVFSFTPGTNTSFDIFGEGNVPSWMPASGTSDVSPSWTSTVSPATAPAANFAWMAATSDYPHRQIEIEGIAQKIPPLRAGDSYSLSFFLQKADILGFGGWQTGTMDKFSVVLMHCADATAAFPSYGSPYALPNIPVPSQQIVCLYNVSNTSWEQYFISFTADADYDMILIYPEVGYRPFQTFPNNADPNVYISAVAFAYPELMATRDLAITTALDNPGDCDITLSVKCGITNAEYTWKNPDGNIVGQGSVIDIPGDRPGIYTVDMTVPASPGSSNNGCSDNNPAITAQINLTQLTTGTLQMTKASATYDVQADGISVFGSGQQTTDFLSSASCHHYNLYNLCHFIDEGYINFNLSSNQSHGNTWEIYRDNQLVPTASGNTTIGFPVPDNTLQDYNPVIGFIEFRSPTTFEIRLTNTILNETKSLFITLKPQAILNANICATTSSPAGWFTTAISSIYTTASTQFVWNMSNAPGSFQYTQPSLTDPNIVYDPSSLSGSFTASVRTVGSQYGCERMRWATISPLLYECNGVHGRVGLISSKKNSNALLLYPNPATSAVNVVTQKNMEQVDLVGIDGRKIKSVRTTGTRTMLPLAELRQGTYLLLIKYKDGTWENKLIIKQ